MAQIKSVKANLPLLNKGDGTGLFINDAATQSVNPTANDTLDFKIPKGFELSMLLIRVPDMDSSTGLAGKIGFASMTGGTTVDIGGVDTNNDDDYFVAAGALGQAAALLDVNFPPVTFEEDVYLRITWTVAASGTFTAGTIRVTMGGNMVGTK